MALRSMHSDAGPWVEITPQGSGQRLRYSDLSAQDDLGKSLPTAMQVAGERIVLSIDTSNARFPISIDPLIGAQQDEIKASDGAGGNQFGARIAISGNSAVIGASGANNNLGKAYIFTRASGDTLWKEEAQLVASDAASNASFATRVAISGDIAVVGAPYAAHDGINYAGQAYVFARQKGGTVWTQEAILKASDAASGDSYGYALAIDNVTVAVGAHSASVPNGGSPVPYSQAGKVYIYVRDTSHVPPVWTKQAILTATDPQDNGWFGDLVELSGDTLAVGAYTSYPTSAYIWTRASGGTTWSEQARITTPNGASGYFAESLALSGDTAVFGDWQAPVAGKNAAGAAFVYARKSGGISWDLQAKLTANMPSANLNFGHYVGLSGDILAAGPASPTEVALFTRVNDGSGMWTLQGQVSSQDNAYIGLDLALDGNTLMVAKQTVYPTPGAVTVYGLGVSNGEACTNDSQCLVSHVCVAGLCGQPAGAPCTDNTECQNSLCTSGQCRVDANLSVLASASPATATGQQPVAVRIKVGNSGPNDATQATLTLDLPADSGFSANNAAGQGWTCQNMPASIVCTIASIPVGDAPDVTLDVIPPFVQTSFIIKASISSPAFDVNMANNTRDLVISNSAPCMDAACGMGGTGGMDGGTGGMNGGGQKGGGCQIGIGPQQTTSAWVLLAFAALCLLWRRHFRVLRG